MKKLLLKVMRKKNKWNYYSNQSIGYTVYIKPTIYNYKYFGFPPYVFTEIIIANKLMIIFLNNCFHYYN